jgi:hypothetical protein
MKIFIALVVVGTGGRMEGEEELKKRPMSIVALSKTRKNRSATAATFMIYFVPASTACNSS